MYTVRRIPSASPAYYRPRFTVVESRSRPKYSAFKTFLWIGAVLVGLLVAWAGITYWPQRLSVVKTLPSLISIQSIPPNLNDPPIYPGAQDLRVVSSQQCGKEITFTTPDSNNQIAAFYTDALPKNGWQQPQDLYGDLYSSWIKYTLDGTPLGSYELAVQFTGYSKKEVRLVVGNCYQEQSQASDTANSILASPTPTPPIINITRQQYEDALAKWTAAGIEEYEITTSVVTPWGHEGTLRVSDHGKGLLLLRYSEWSSTKPDWGDTVEGMFAEVSRILADNTEAYIDAAMTKDRYYEAHTVEFDPDLGYPVQIIGFAVTAPNTWVSDASWGQKVHELRILKRSSSRP
jgi:hypothetical protein